MDSSRPSLRQAAGLPTSPAGAARIDPVAIASLVNRVAHPARDRWLEQVERAGGCRRPIRLRGRIMRGGRLAYSTADEPDGALMVRCRNRREVCCPSCAHEYRGDMWQLVYAGLAGGRKGVPESVRMHPMVFVTLTAPSFGPVHTRRDDGRPCCCGALHAADDTDLGAPIHPDAYDYAGAVLWNWHAPELWRRFVVDVGRLLAATLGISERDLRARARISFTKVSEFQARGLVHFHAIVRLDGPDGPESGPPFSVGARELVAAIEAASRRVRLTAPDANGELVELRFGAQVHARTLVAGGEGEGVGAEAVAAYIAKYSAKGSHEGITDRRSSPDDLRERGVPEHLVQMVRAAISLAGRPALAGLGRWTHTLGFRGHFVTKSRAYSTTLGALRAARAAYRDAEVPCDGSAPILAEWEYAGSGYLSPGDALLAAGVEARLRERREARHDRRGPPDDEA